MKGLQFIELRDSLSRLLHAPVDLATPDALHPALRDSILREAVQVAWGFDPRDLPPSLAMLLNITRAAG
jgi:hypothetical protein